MTSIEDLDDALLFYGIHACYPDQRHAMAASLFAEGVTEDDVRMIGDHVREHSDTKGSACRILASVLANKDRRDTHLLDLRRRANLGKPRIGDKPYRPAPMEGEDATAWREDREALSAYSMHAHGDTFDRIANLTGIPLLEVEAVVSRGRKAHAKLYGPPPKKREKLQVVDDKEEAERRRQRIEECRRMVREGKP